MSAVAVEGQTGPRCRGQWIRRRCAGSLPFRRSEQDPPNRSDEGASLLQDPPNQSDEGAFLSEQDPPNQSDEGAFGL